MIYPSAYKFSGSAGPQGIPGITGIYGGTGLYGPTGINGATGIMGFTGLALGSTGIQGTTGIYGLTGIYGQTGFQGVTGFYGLTGTQGITGLANFLDSTGYPQLTVMPILLYNNIDDTLFCGSSADGTNWIQISAGSMQGATGTMGFTGLALGSTGIQGLTGFYGATGIQAKTGTLTFSISTPIGSVATGIMGQTVLTGNTAFNNWYLLADASSSINVDVQKSTYANYPATATLHGTTGLFLAATVKNTGTTNYWSGTTGASGDVLRVILAGSDATASKVSLSLTYTLF